MKYVFTFMFLLFAVSTTSTAGAEMRAEVKALFERDMANVDFAEVMVAVERIINPRLDGEVILAEIDRMASHIQTAIPQNAPEWGKVDAIRQYIYEPGYWNDNRAFAYDLDDPYGLKFENRLLSDYLADRRGNCLTMPFLFIAIGQRLGLDMRPSLAPQHVLVRFTTQDGENHNIEATNGGLRGDNTPYLNNMPITPEAIANRVFLATLSNEEAIAVVAVIVVEYLIKEKRYHDAMAVADTLLNHYPNFAYAMVKKGTAAYYLLKTKFYDLYPTAKDVPEDQRNYLAYLQMINQGTFDKADALGWRRAER
jgi:regulator of sirC expression with transglutaminase-like and TPR domain